MDYRQNGRMNAPAARPASPIEGSPMQFAGDTSQTPAAGQRRGGSKRLWVVSAFAALLMVALVAGAVWWLASKNTSNTAASAIKTDAYQAVFLTNGQVYFGKLQETKGDYITIKDIYYLQVQQAVQPAEKKEEGDNVQLIKLGNELHGPEDQMQINSQQVLFWENLKPDSKVSQAIAQYKQ